MITTAAAQLGLAALTPTQASLHSAYPGTDGGTAELSGGSYARVSITFGAASGRTRTQTGSAQFDVPAGATVAWGVIWGSGPTALSIAPIGGSPRAYTADLSSETIQSPGHGYTDGTRVVFYGGGGSPVPGGITAGTTYYVINSTADNFQVSASQGGSAVNLTSQPDRTGFVSRIGPEVYTGAGTYSLTGSTINL